MGGHVGDRDSHAKPMPLEPGKRYRVKLQLNDVAQIFPKGHRIRIAVSSSYFPLAWPSAESTQLRIYTGCSRLILLTGHPEFLMNLQPVTKL
ncbi:CocE/NonD family hydrolase C-terminal non-catalytic domain-containing protein [Shewanella sediminis]|uniref:CocE/NonD family hydrolase C-terminal non-catalytic domain-containing protein n=1 Tax=Shewanella sediminis TaxID=271097 RepID=UPI000A005524|nr:CocE/NonD family hydrolase C-terminal non-catalytic domain-containing protein [Shewanella sediminis]